MLPTPLVWLRRFFDVTCAILGLTLLGLLGPWMLVHAITDLLARARSNLCSRASRDIFDDFLMRPPIS